MNILYINHYAGGPEYGMEYRSHYLAREWVRAGHRVTIVAASQSHVRSRQPAVDGAFTNEVVEGARYLWCATPAYRGNGVGRVVNIFAFLRRLGQLRRCLDAEPDVVIASSGRVVEELTGPELRAGAPAEPYTRQLLQASLGYERQAAAQLTTFD